MNNVKFHSVSSYPSLDEKATTIYATPKWKFPNGPTASMKRSMTAEEIQAFPVEEWVEDNAHCYLRVPNSMLAEGLQVMKSWGFNYKTKLDLIYISSKGNPVYGLGTYFRTSSETILFGVRGKMRTLSPARSMTNIMYARKGKPFTTPEELYQHIEAASPGPYLELFSRVERENWQAMGNESTDIKCSFPTSETYKAA